MPDEVYLEEKKINFTSSQLAHYFVRIIIQIIKTQ